MTNRQFEETMKDAIIKSYVSVMGEAKWNSLTNTEKDSLMHIMINGFAKPILAAR